MQPIVGLSKEEVQRRHDNWLKTLLNAITKLHMKLQGVAAD